LPAGAGSQQAAAAESRAREAIPLLVVGAHLSGMPLNHQLIALDAELIGEVRTAPSYRLYALETQPPKPGLVRVDNGEGAAIAGELWALSPEALGRLLSNLPQPMALGRVELEDGRRVVGFLCEPVATVGATEITGSGGWRSFVAGGAPALS
jgi:allophanate hydrolase